MKKNNIFKVVCVTLLLVVLLTWILPTTTFYGSDLTVGDRIQVGFFDLFTYIGMLITNFGQIPAYILAVGGFYGVLHKTNGYRNLLDKIVQKYKGNEWIFLTLVMILFAVITSVAGLNIGLLFLFPFIITVILLMGYSKVTAALVTIGSVCVGLIGTTYSAHDLGLLNQVLNVSASSEILYKIVILVLGLILLIVNTLLYAKKHKIDGPRKGFHYPETENKKAKSWPIVLVMDLALLIMILSFISWEDVFEVKIFADALTAIQDFKLFGFPIFAKLLGGTVSAFGNWQITELMTLVLVATAFVALFCKVKLNDMFQAFGEGARRALRPAFMATLVYLVVVIAVYSPIALTIIKPLMDLTKNFNVVTTSLAGILSQFFSVEMYFNVYPEMASATLPYVISLYSDSVYSVIGVIWQAMSGFAMLFVPTSVVLVATLSYLKVSYFKWLKAIWKFLLELFAVLLIVFFLMIML